MRKWRKFMTLLLSAVFVAICVVAAGCGGSGSGGKVAYLNYNDGSSTGKKLKAEFQARADAEGINVDYQDAHNDISAQIDQLNAAIDSGAKAIVLLAVDSERLAPTVKRAEDAGIPVIALNRSVEGTKSLSVLSDEKEAGRLQGERLKSVLPKGANVLYLEGSANQAGAQKRFEGFKEACLDQRSDITLLDKQDGDYSKSEAMKITAVWLKLYPKIDAIVCGNDEMATGALRALKSAGRTGVIVTGVDAKGGALDAIGEGTMLMTVWQDVKGQADAAFDLVSQIMKGSKPTEGQVIPFKVVDKDNVAQFK